MSMIKRLLTFRPQPMDEDTKGGLIFLGWVAWVFVVMATAQHFGWVTP